MDDDVGDLSDSGSVSGHFKGGAGSSRTKSARAGAGSGVAGGGSSGGAAGAGSAARGGPATSGGARGTDAHGSLSAGPARHGAEPIALRPVVPRVDNVKSSIENMPFRCGIAVSASAAAGLTCREHQYCW